MVRPITQIQRHVQARPTGPVKPTAASTSAAASSSAVAVSSSVVASRKRKHAGGDDDKEERKRLERREKLREKIAENTLKHAILQPAALFKKQTGTVTHPICKATGKAHMQQVKDKDGALVVDADGEPVMEKVTKMVGCAAPVSQAKFKATVQLLAREATGTAKVRLPESLLIRMADFMYNKFFAQDRLPDAISRSADSKRWSTRDERSQNLFTFGIKNDPLISSIESRFADMDTLMGTNCLNRFHTIHSSFRQQADLILHEKAKASAARSIIKHLRPKLDALEPHVRKVERLMVNRPTAEVENVHLASYLSVRDQLKRKIALVNEDEFDEHDGHNAPMRESNAVYLFHLDDALVKRLEVEQLEAKFDKIDDAVIKVRNERANRTRMHTDVACPRTEPEKTSYLRYSLETAQKLANDHPEDKKLSAAVETKERNICLLVDKITAFEEQIEELTRPGGLIAVAKALAKEARKELTNQNKKFDIIESATRRATEEANMSAKAKKAAAAAAADEADEAKMDIDE